MGSLTPEHPVCRSCGILVPPDAPFAHCPNCLVRLGFGSSAEDWSDPEPRTTRLGNYELLGIIGRGGMGVVYRARQIGLERIVALKMLGPYAAAFPDIAGRLRLEAEVAGSLRHPQIVTIYDVGEHDGQPFFAMELIEGVGLDKLIGPDGFRSKPQNPQKPDKRSAPEADIARVMIQIARAVDHAHKHGVLHRDLKPANVLIDAQEQPHLTDFGVAKVLGRIATTGTASGAILGTPSYMAPEQASGAAKNASTASDIYSLGAILYEMLTGRAPFWAETPLEIMRQVVEQHPPHPSTFNRGLDSDLGVICLKCLEKNPAHRYESARDMAEDLERWLHGEPIQARPVHRLRRFWLWCCREPVLASLLAGLFLLLTAVALLGFSLLRQESRRLDDQQRFMRVQRSALLDRIERASTNDNQHVHITPQEVAVLSDRLPLIDGTETAVTVGVLSRLRKPDEAVYLIAPLINYLQTNQMPGVVLPLLFELNIYKDRTAALQGFLDGQVDLLNVDPSDYIHLRRRHARVIPLVMQLQSGQPLRGVIFAKADSGLHQLTDLKEKSFSFGHPMTALGEYLPKAALAASGLTSNNFLSLTNSRSTAVITAVQRGELDAGVAEWDDLQNAIRFGGARLTVLHQFQCAGHPWVANAGMSSRTAEIIREGFMSYRNADVAVPFDPRLSGFESIEPSSYDSLEQAMETARHFDQP